MVGVCRRKEVELDVFCLRGRDASLEFGACAGEHSTSVSALLSTCLLNTPDAADEERGVDVGGGRILYK